MNKFWPAKLYYLSTSYEIVINWSDVKFIICPVILCSECNVAVETLAVVIKIANYWLNTAQKKLAPSKIIATTFLAWHHNSLKYQ